MKALLNLSLILTIALLATHEMDAMTHAEWRLLPGLSRLPDDLARQVFVLLHVPLYAVVFWTVFVAPWKRLAAQIVCALTIVHALAHWFLSENPDYTFAAPIETITVYGSALTAMCYLALAFKERSH